MPSTASNLLHAKLLTALASRCFATIALIVRGQTKPRLH